MHIHDPNYRHSPEAAEHARFDAYMAGLPAARPAISLVKTAAGKAAVTSAMVDVIEAMVAGNSAVTKDALRKRFTDDEIDACFQPAMARIRPSIRALAA